MDLFRHSPQAPPLTSEGARNNTLVKRLRVLLHAFPLFQLSQSDSRRDDALRHYDTLVVALKILDVVAERMGMEVEADRDYIDFSLVPLLDGMDRQAGLLPDIERHQRITDRVMAALCNDTEARRPFAQAYSDFDESGEVVQRRLEFRLLYDAFSLTGDTVLRLTNEAANLYFNALELDIEDSQAATEAIVHSQLCRGKFDEALSSAHFAVRQSRFYRDRLTRLLRDTRRDISRVDWAEMAPKLITDAMNHLEARLEVEQNIIQTTQARLDILTPGTSESAAVARIATKIEECIETHAVLQRELMNSRTTFLESQAQQAFVPVQLTSRPDLMAEVVEPLLRMNITDALNVVDHAMAHLMAPQPPPLLSLCFLFDGLLSPRRQIRHDWIHIDAVSPDHFVRDLQQHSEIDRDIAELLMQSLVRPTTLSDLLAYARAKKFTTAQCEVIVLIVMQHFDPESIETPLIRVEKTGDWLDDPDYFGDEVMIHPIETIQER